MIIKHVIYYIFRVTSHAGILSIFGIGSVVFAADQEGFGQIAENLIIPVTVVSGFLAGAAIAVGLACIFGAFIRYMQYRVNPLAQPIGTVITLFILGILLLCLPLIYKLTESGIPFSLG